MQQLLNCILCSPVSCWRVASGCIEESWKMLSSSQPGVWGASITVQRFQDLGGTRPTLMQIPLGSCYIRGPTWLLLLALAEVVRPGSLTRGRRHQVDVCVRVPRPWVDAGCAAPWGAFRLCGFPPCLLYSYPWVFGPDKPFELLQCC